MPDLEPSLRALLAERLGVPAAGVSADTLLLEDLGVDSLALIELTMAVEARYGVTLPDDRMARVHSVADLAALLAGATASR